MELATRAKSAVEDAQREQRKWMEERHEKHIQKYFEQREGRWVPKIEYVPPRSFFSYLRLTFAVFFFKSPVRSFACNTTCSELAFPTKTV
jgi:hypothetical protein